jgi:hypothetical protein
VAGYTFDPRIARYRGPDGRFITERTMQGALVALSDASAERMAGLASRLQAGSLKLAEWQAGMMAEIKTTHLAAALAAKGGRQMMSPADFGAAGAQIKVQYQHLGRWAADIVSGKAALGDGLVSRARLYARASASTFDAMRIRDARNSGAEMEERNLSHSADPCGECPTLSRRGWVPLGTLPPVGTRQCVANCRCTIERRLVVREVAA